MASWQMQTAKARFSELVEHAAHEPQEITRHGRTVAMMVSHALFERLCGGEQSLVEFMRASPLAGHDEIAFERNRSLPREIAL